MDETGPLRRHLAAGSGPRPSRSQVLEQGGANRGIERGQRHPIQEEGQERLRAARGSQRIAQQLCGDIASDGALRVLRLGSRWDMAFLTGTFVLAAGALLFSLSGWAGRLLVDLAVTLTVIGVGADLVVLSRVSRARRKAEDLASRSATAEEVGMRIGSRLRVRIINEIARVTGKTASGPVDVG